MYVEKRPWGYFERFTLNEPCTVKLVYVDSNKRLSLQYHHERSEFWKIIRGPVKVQLDEEQILLQTGDTITIPMRARHRLEGIGINAVILEISKGHFDEDDITRIEDDFSRV